MLNFNVKTQDILNYSLIFLKTNIPNIDLVLYPEISLFDKKNLYIMSHMLVNHINY